MSFMKTMNKRGTKIDHWGTPAFMSRQLEVELLITTCCILSDKQFFTQDNNDPLIPIDSSL